MKKLFSADVLRLQRELEYRNYSASTVSTYCQLMDWLERKSLKPLNQVTTDDVKIYLQQAITERNVSSSYINQTISAFKVFITDVIQSEWSSFKIKRPRREKKLPVVLSLLEVEQLIARTINLKHRAMITVMYSAGLRRMEVLHLKAADIDSSTMRIKVIQGKGKKDRFTLLAPSALHLLRDYYKTYRPKTWLFEPNGKAGCQVSEKTLEEIVKQAANRANINKRVSCHTLRHSFATHLLESGVSIRHIQEFLGHTSIKTTSMYLHLINFNPANVRSPLDNMHI